MTTVSTLFTKIISKNTKVLSLLEERRDRLRLLSLLPYVLLAPSLFRRRRVLSRLQNLPYPEFPGKKPQL